VAVSLPASAGQTVDAQVSLDTRSLVEAAVQHMTLASESRTRFTNFEFAHYMDFDSAGRKFIDHTVLFEQTWINDIHYDHLVEYNGKPLTGEALEAEDKRYDDAIAHRGEYGLKEHSGGRLLAPRGISVRNILTPDYVLRETGRKKSREGELRIVEASLTGRTPPDALCPWKYTLRILESPPTLMYYRVDSKNDPSKQCHDAMEEVTNEIVEGYPMVSHSHLVAFVPNPSGYVRDEAEYTYTKYRRFTVSIKLKFNGATIDAAPAGVPPSMLPPNK
jgi:hypothetical protein